VEIYSEILKAEKRIKKYIRKTPLEFSPYLSELCSSKVYLKLESEQLTGSFKIRGAFNKFLADKGRLKNGFITASTGNHGKAVGYVSKLLGLKGTVFVPETVAKAKLEAIQSYGMNIEKYEGDSGKVEMHARNVALERKTPFISPYNDFHIAAGQGTIGCELFTEFPSADVLLACIGGGGLISGVGSYLKNRKKEIRIIGCEPKNSCEMSASIKRGKQVFVKHKPTLSDGSAGGVEPDSITFGLCQKYVDDYLQVPESEIKKSMFLMIDKHKKIIEGAAAVALAALIANKKMFVGKNVVVILSGSGVGVETIRKVMD
jgi:threonine dehydratase